MKQIILTLVLLLSLVLLNGYTVSGYTNSIDSPIEGAIVELYDQLPTSIWPIETAFSDETGFYSFDITDPGIYYVAAIIEGPIVQSLYYDNIYDPNLATPIQVNDDNPNPSDINFEFQLTIPQGDNSVFGTITELDETPIEFAYIELIPVRYSNPWMMSFYADSDQNGNYIFEDIPDGEYLMYVFHFSYFEYYYNGAPSLEQADIILLENGVAVEIDIVLEPFVQYTLSGYVFDAETNEPIVGAEIYAFSPGSGLGFEPLAWSDESGYYEMLLPVGMYHVMAHDIMTKDVEFYDNASTPHTATWIILDDNISGIDFQLNDDLGGNYSISGTITQISVPPEDPPKILAVAVSSDEDWEETVMADDTGGYIIPDLPSESYYVYGYSLTSVPTYYENSINFDEAVIVDLQSNVTGIDINLQTAQENGYFQCTGFVLDHLGNPVANAAVAFLDSYGNIHDYAYSNDNGEYVVPSLGGINYTALATKTFYNTDSTQLPMNGNQSWNFTLIDPNTDSEQELINTGNLLEVTSFPNPFNPQTTIRFSLPHFAEETEISIFNIKGQKVYHKMLGNLAKGSYAVSWQAQDEYNKSLSSGVYFIAISADTYFGTGKLLLLK